ncbi:hypothetical protein NKI48_09455 [Mesorhizobium sp. M0644]|uniref:hypothetical protein n=1 Tax=unclassified Mesorhizobium TaxID=325217 RepID=UPI0003CEB7FD|nr:hypothetical protein [Mesorhizobium sp. LSJC280B00]ESW88995.1 hypothetical protein X772_08735 [Mesorhizobium sp. LSJC280B00]
MDVPASMKAELAAWNNGSGIDLQSWVGCEGRFALAVGYSTIFWPKFVTFERYVLMEGFSEEGLRSFERDPNATRQSVEAVMNHLHIADIHALGAADISRDKLVFLGSVLKEIYEAKLQWQFANRRFVVEFFASDSRDLEDYQLSFWQAD